MATTLWSWGNINYRGASIVATASASTASTTSRKAASSMWTICIMSTTKKISASNLIFHAILLSCRNKSLSLTPFKIGCTSTTNGHRPRSGKDNKRKKGFFFVLYSIWINFSRSRMQIHLYSLRLIEILHYLCTVGSQSSTSVDAESGRQ